MARQTSAERDLIDTPRAWLAAVGVAVANGIAFGTAYTFGTFFDTMANEFGADRGPTAVIFALTLLGFFGFGVIAGPRADSDGPHVLLFAGGALFVGGLLYTSLVEELWVGYLTYAIGVGIGSGCFVAPLTGVAGLLFERRRAAALGVVATGNGLGTLILIPLSEWLISSYGWRVAYRWLAVIGLVGFLFAAATIVRPPRRAAGPSTATGSFSTMIADQTFRRLFGSATFMSIALFSAFAFIVPFATDNGVSSATAARVFSVIGLSSIVGRLALTNLSSRLGALRLYQIMLVLQPVAYAVWYFASGSVALLVVFALILGTTYGGFVAISPEVALTLFGGANVGRLMGLLFLAFGIGGLVGPPITGWLADTQGQDAVILTVIAAVVVAIAIGSLLGRPVTSITIGEASSGVAQDVAPVDLPILEPDPSVAQ